MSSDVLFVALMFGIITIGIAILVGPTLWRDYKERKGKKDF